jgi:lipoate-protein ligase A
VLKHQQCALAGLIHATVERQGQTDLTIGGLKICGHAQRRKRNCLIFHGCFLLNLDFALMEKALPMPSRQPDYRLSRSHSDFLINLKLSPQQVRSALTKVWEAEEVFMGFPMDEIRRLARDKYETDEWNFKF